MAATIVFIVREGCQSFPQRQAPSPPPGYDSAFVKSFIQRGLATLPMAKFLQEPELRLNSSRKRTYRLVLRLSYCRSRSYGQICPNKGLTAKFVSRKDLPGRLVLSASCRDGACFASVRNDHRGHRVVFIGVLFIGPYFQCSHLRWVNRQVSGAVATRW